jgi:hypothetical protein
MKTLLSSTELPTELEGFVGGMGLLSIASITESDLGFDLELDVKGYISQPVEGIYYAEVIDSDGNCDYAAGEIDEMQKWITETVYKVCNY